MKRKLLGYFAGSLYKYISLTYRYHLYFENEEDKREIMDKIYDRHTPVGEAHLYAFFHQDEFSTIPYFKDKGLNVLVSKSKDGQLMVELAHIMGYRTIRGSSSRGAVAGFMAAFKLVKQGGKLSMAVDGPKGPIYKVKQGLPKISQKTNQKILPFRAFPKCFWFFPKAWNKAKFPKPFSRIDMVFGKPDLYNEIELEKKLLSLQDYSKLHYLKS